MKKAGSLIFIVFLLCSLCLVACGGKGGDTSQTKTTQATSGKTTTATPGTTTQAKTTTAASSSGQLWNDMPVYSGASQTQKASWSVPPTENEDYSKFEWRYYETSAGIEAVSAFYKSQMPAKGWTETGWFEMEDVHWGLYNKNNENDAAMIWLNKDDGKTVIAMWRATR